MVGYSGIAVSGFVSADPIWVDPTTDAENAPGSTEMSPNTDSNGLSRMLLICNECQLGRRFRAAFS